MKKTFSLLAALSILASFIGNMPIYAAAGDIDESQWVVFEENDFSVKATDTLISSKYWGAQAYVNSDYGYAYNGSGSTDNDHWLAMKNGVAGDFVVDFDLFYDDIRNATNSNYSIYMGLAKDMTLPSGAVAYTYSELWYTNLLSLSSTLQDDSGTAYSYMTALATRKYNTVTVPEGEPSYLNMRIAVIGDTSTIYAKWNTASTWKTLKTKTASPAGYAGEKWLYWTLGAKMGVDNFKVYQKASRVTNETFDYQTETWKDLLTLSNYSSSWNKTLEGGWLQIANSDNQIAMKKSYSDYILQFDYRPNYVSSNRRLIFKIGGYEFHMTNMDTGIGSPAGVDTGAHITKENDYVFPNQTWATFKIKKAGKSFWLYTKPTSSDAAFTLLYKGTFDENRKSPFEFNVTGTSGTSGSAFMDNLVIWNLTDEEQEELPVLEDLEENFVKTVSYDNNDDYSKALLFHPYEYYIYYNILRDEAGYLYNIYSGYENGGMILDHGTDLSFIPNASDDDFAVKFDIFLNDRNTGVTSGNKAYNYGDTLMNTMASNGFEDYFTLDVYENSGDTDSSLSGKQYKKIASGGQHKWEVETLADDNGNSYILANARSSKIYGENAITGYSGNVGNDADHKYIEILQIIRNKTLYTFARWNENTVWHEFDTPVKFTTDTSYFATVRDQMALGFDNIEIYRPKISIDEGGTFVMESNETMTFKSNENITVTDSTNAATITDNGTKEVTVSGKGYYSILSVSGASGSEKAKIKLNGIYNFRPGLNQFTGTKSGYDIENDLLFEGDVSLADNPIKNGINTTNKALKISSDTKAAPSAVFSFGKAFESERAYIVEFDVLGTVNGSYSIQKNGSNAQTLTGISSAAWQHITSDVFYGGASSIGFALQGAANNSSYALYIDNISVIPAYQIQYVNEKEENIEFPLYYPLMKDGASMFKTAAQYAPDYNPNANYVIDGTSVRFKENYTLAGKDLKIIVKPNDDAIMFSADNATIIVPEGNSFEIPDAYEINYLRANNFVTWKDAQGNTVEAGTIINTADYAEKTLYAYCDKDAFSRSPSDGSIVNFAPDRYNNWMANYSVGSIIKYVNWINITENGVKFAWENGNDVSSYTLKYSENADMSNAKQVSTGTTPYATVYYLYADTDYYWQVITTHTDSTTETSEVWSFKTADVRRCFNLVSNMRDIGNLKTEDGNYRIKQGMAYRAGLYPAAANASAIIGNLGITTELSLRGPEDGGRTVSVLGESVSYTCLDGTHYFSGDHHYTNAAAREVLKNEVAFFADVNHYPMYYHCSAGRDRTGVISYIIEGLLGIGEDVLMQDYEMTGFCDGSFNSSEFLDGIAKMQALNTYINSNYEGDAFKDKMENFCLDIGVTQNQINSIRDILLEKINDEYTVADIVYNKASVVNGETVTASATVTKNYDNAKTDGAVLFTVIYKKIGANWQMYSISSDTETLTVGDPVNLSTSVTIPDDGGEYKLSSFLWNSTDEMYPYCEVESLQ